MLATINRALKATLEMPVVADKYERGEREITFYGHDISGPFSKVVLYDQKGIAFQLDCGPSPTTIEHDCRFAIHLTPSMQSRFSRFELRGAV